MGRGLLPKSDAANALDAARSFVTTDDSTLVTNI